MVQFIIITGRPGIGKTTALRKVIEELRRKNIPTVGFYTEEVREMNRRIGFDVVSLDGRREKLARTLAGAERCQHHLRKYAINIPGFNNVLGPLFGEFRLNRKQVFILDEIGKMEYFSSEFRRNLQEVLDSECVMVAVVGLTFVTSIVSGERMAGLTRVFMMNAENRNTIVQPIIEEVQKAVEDSSLFRDAV